MQRKKRVDIFAPSQAIQDAKEKLGPSFFDASLLECSRNAVELTKLVSKWDDLEKKKVKCIRDINRDQDRLMRHMKTYRTGPSNMETEAASYIEGVEALDGKVITPGFRFKSNGDIKPSATSLPTVIIDNEVELDSPSVVDFTPVNYENEIHELECVIYDIYADLARSQINLSNMTSYKHSNVKTYLRAHKNEYIPTSELMALQNYKTPNDRFAFKPGSSAKSDGNLHKKTVKCPSHRSCTGCQFRLMAKNDDSLKMKDNLRSCRDYCKTRWNIAPQGKYVHPANALSSSTSLTQKLQKSSTLLNAQLSSSGLSTTRKPSMLKSQVKFQNVESVNEYVTYLPMSKAISMKDTTSRVHELERQSHSCPAVDLKSRKSGSALSGRQSDIGGRCLSSSMSRRSRLSSAPSSARHLVDQESRINLLKSIQAGEEEHCQRKVDTFLKKLDSDSHLIHV